MSRYLVGIDLGGRFLFHLQELIFVFFKSAHGRRQSIALMIVLVAKLLSQSDLLFRRNVPARRVENGIKSALDLLHAARRGIYICGDYQRSAPRRDPFNHIRGG